MNPRSSPTVRALCRALATYRDPADRGLCAECGSRRLDPNLHCRDCGRLHGILGEVIAQHAIQGGQQGFASGRGAPLPQQHERREGGIDPTADPEIHVYETRVEDTYLLCSDGLSGSVKKEEIAELAAQYSELPALCSRPSICANCSRLRTNTLH